MYARAPRGRTAAHAMRLRVRAPPGSMASATIGVAAALQVLGACMSLLLASCLMTSTAAAEHTHTADAVDDYDVLVYGATSGGVIAAVSAARSGVARVALLDPGKRIGGMTTGGLSSTDVGSKQVIGGMALELYRENGRHYGMARPQFNWEPHIALELLHRMIEEAQVTLVQNAQVETVAKAGSKLTGLTTVDGRSFTARVLISADYEGDLMPRAGISWTHGREGRDMYNESLAGYRLANQGHEFSVAINPYQVLSNGSRKLLPMMTPWNPPAGDPVSAEGKGDNRTQAYNFRLCVTTNRTNLVPFAKPNGYDPTYWELARRYFTHPLIAPKVHAPCGNVASYCGGGGIGLKRETT